MNTPAPFSSCAFRKDAFNCPYCQAFAVQQWGAPFLTIGQQQIGQRDGFWTCICNHCNMLSVWIENRMVHPIQTAAAPANIDLPDDIKIDYQEAASIISLSPRGASALLRLAIQKLCKHLGEKGKNINDDIASLVKKGLPLQIQQSLDIVRVVGNNAIHPGQLDLTDDQKTAMNLFGLVNLIAEVMISQPKHVSSLYETILPESLKEAIKERDGK